MKEYPLVFEAEQSRIISIDPQSENYLSGKLLARFDADARSHILVFEEREAIKAGLTCLMRKIEVEPGVLADFCFVGSVVTAPEFRQQGLQKELFHVLMNACFDAKVDFVVLWSNQLEFYQKLGFSLGGLQASWSSETFVRLSDGSIKVNTSENPSQIYRKEFFDAFRAKRLSVFRSEDEMKILFEIPKMKAYYTERAYILVGKGEDFPLVCHEWAGPSREVLACIEKAWQEAPQLRILSPGVVHSPDEAVVVEALERNGFETRLEYLALFRCLNPHYRIEDLQPEDLKYPFFIWGLDSI